MCSTKTYLVIFVTSALTNFIQRQTIRQTWAAGNFKEQVVIYFLVGFSTNDQLKEEINLYNDLIVTNYTDTYKNLTYKSIEFLKFANRKCKRARYILKTDDDVYVNVNKLLTDLDASLTRFIMGNLIVEGKVIRDKKSKWYVDDKTYPASTYPPYMSGTAYLISGDIIPELYKQAITQEPFIWEDVFITGICSKQIKGLHLIHSTKFTFRRTTLNKRILERLITIHGLNSKQMKVLHHTLNKF